MRITDIVWKEATVAKIADKHGVTVEQVEETLALTPVVRRVARGNVRGEDVYAALGRTSAGRYLIVFFIDKGRGVILPISARDMSPTEKRYYERIR